MTYRILDLYCGAGGAAIGYDDAGFDVVGVDLSPQPRYPYAFIQHDALKLDTRFLLSFDAIHASPPCQRWTAMRHAKGAKGGEHPDLIAPTREMLKAIGLPYVIENVEGAPLEDPIMLCGSMFGLGVMVNGVHYQLRRHRLFECNFPVSRPPCLHSEPVIGVYGGHVRCRSAKHGGRRTADFEDLPSRVELAHVAMGWPCRATMAELSEAVPPSYTSHIGSWLQAHIWRRSKAA